MVKKRITNKSVLLGGIIHLDWDLVNSSSLNSYLGFGVSALSAFSPSYEVITAEDSIFLRVGLALEILTDYVAGFWALFITKFFFWPDYSSSDFFSWSCPEGFSLFSPPSPVFSAFWST